MHPYCAVKLNIIKLGCAQGEGKEMGVVRDICSAQSSSPCSWGDLKREWGGWGRSPQHCSEQLCLGRGVSLSMDLARERLGPGSVTCGAVTPFPSLICLPLLCPLLLLSQLRAFIKMLLAYSGVLHQAGVFSKHCNFNLCVALFFLLFFCRAALIRIPHRGNREFCISKSVQQILKSYLWIFYNTQTDLKSLLKKAPDTLQQY